MSVIISKYAVSFSSSAYPENAFWSISDYFIAVLQFATRTSWQQDCLVGLLE